MQVSFSLVLRRVNVGRIYSSIAKDLKFNWLIQVTWKGRALVNSIRLGIFAGVAARKLTNTPAVIFSDPSRSRWFIFTKQIIVLLWVIIYSYLQGSFKIGVLKTLYTIHRKTTVSESLLWWRFLSYINQSTDMSKIPCLNWNNQNFLNISDSTK